MKKIIITVVTLIALTIAYWLISPLFITKVVDEKLSDIYIATDSNDEEKDDNMQTGIVDNKKGEFIGLKGHNAEGQATLLKIKDKYFLRFENDFLITNGPDLFVHLGKDGVYDKEALLGNLKGSKGGQNYEIPSHINVSLYNEVWVWCRAFFVPFGRAELK